MLSNMSKRCLSMSLAYRRVMKLHACESRVQLAAGCLHQEVLGGDVGCIGCRGVLRVFRDTLAGTGPDSYTMALESTREQVRRPGSGVARPAQDATLHASVRRIVAGPLFMAAQTGDPNYVPQACTRGRACRCDCKL